MADGSTKQETDGDDSPVTVSVTHGSFDSAAYALMIGIYSDEDMSGAERFLDRQFGQLLSGWQDLGHYPGPLGTSVFVEPGRDVAVECEPIGAYLAGLGSSLTLDRRQLRFAVYRALADRCLTLYPPVDEEADDPSANEVCIGFSAALLGVRDDEGLRVEDSVTGILEGIWDVNRRLADYEQGRALRFRVRVGHVEFVERYAHRADLAAKAVRHARTAAGLPDGFTGLGDVIVTTGDGALPAGAALLESDRSWQRFAVLERPAAESSTSADDSSAHLVVEVTALGRNARADRLTHRIDRASIDDLMATLSSERSDPDALAALRDRLIPYALRTELLTSTSLQLVVDPATAVFSWEQLAAPVPGPSSSAEPAGAGSILRMFAESEDRRLQPVRAQVGTALVIGAGHADPAAPLPGAIQEALEVGALLDSSRFETRVLVDDREPLSVAELNIELLRGHQILHLACHGSHVEGDKERTGAQLTQDFRLTADLVDAMPVVPELVVINSCYNARIGLNRLAAGLARAFMGIGVRAVVAAGWPIGDAAARAFATSFYTDMLAGRTFGDAVTQARRTASGYGGSSWAAYQCYGDPAFMLRGQTTGLARIGSPVSLTDLQTRIETLLSQIADLSRPRPGTVSNRWDQLVERFQQLEDWSAPFEPAGQPDIRRLLAQAARELGRFDRAAHWYSTFATLDGGSLRPVDRHTSVFHLQQAANCAARAAQESARLSGSPGSGSPPSGRNWSFSEAVALAEAARATFDDSEGAAIHASVYKKWATVTTPGHDRESFLDQALAACDGIVSTTRGDYGVENRIQIVALRDPPEARRLLGTLLDRPTGPARAAAGRTGSRQPLIDAAPDRGGDFWSWVAAGDAALTTLMTAITAEARQQAADTMIRVYRRAFRRRSTYAERYSSIDHLQDIHDLLPDDDNRKQPMRAALDELAPWNRFAPKEAVAPVPSPQPAGVSVERPVERGPAQVRLIALHAACGDCLLLEYTGDSGETHRILIDGGLGSAFDTGLRTVLGSPGSLTRVDVAVVTHVDADHIEGVVRALREHRLTAADYWFNGRDQIAELSGPASARSVKQGDALSQLIPDGERNRVTGGRALVVGADPAEIPLPGGATAVLLSPSRDRLTRLLAKWPEPHRDGRDLDTLLRAFDADLERGPGTFGRDGSLANGASIAFLFEHDGASVLFTADAWASELVSGIKALLDRRNRADAHGARLAALPVQLFKLSHHGSRQNITDELLGLIEPQQILICTDGSKFAHPDQDALDMLRRHYPEVPIHFTDATDVITARAHHVGALPARESPVVIDL